MPSSSSSSTEPLELLREERIEFSTDGLSAERRFDLEPSDWSKHTVLVLEARASSAQQLEIVLITDEGESPLTLMPFEGVWTRTLVPLSLYTEPPRSGETQSDVYNKLHLASSLYHWGPYLSLARVRAIVFRMELPVGTPVLDVRSLVLSAAPPEEAILEDRPLVDEL